MKLLQELPNYVAARGDHSAVPETEWRWAFGTERSSGTATFEGSSESFAIPCHEHWTLAQVATPRNEPWTGGVLTLRAGSEYDDEFRDVMDDSGRAVVVEPPASGSVYLRDRAFLRGHRYIRLVGEAPISGRLFLGFNIEEHERTEFDDLAASWNLPRERLEILREIYQGAETLAEAARKVGVRPGTARAWTSRSPEFSDALQAVLQSRS
jgi:hypothetical protein